MKFLQPCLRVAAFSTTSPTTITTRTLNQARVPSQHGDRFCAVPNGLDRNSQLLQLKFARSNVFQKPAPNDLHLLSSSRSSLFSTQADADIKSDDTASTTTTATTTNTTTNTPEREEQQQEFASSYHAPVMYKECIDALLKKSHFHVKKDKNKYKRNKRHKDENDGVDTIPIEENDNQSGSIRRPRVYIDGTLGGGGHSQCLLERLSPGDVVIGCDVDPSALATASVRLKEYIVKQPKPKDGINSDIEVGDGEKEKEKEETMVAEHNKPIFIPINSNFKDLERHVKALKHPITGKYLVYQDRDCNDAENNVDNDGKAFIGVDGILLDLGVSSHQFDNAERGFAFMKDGPLDMRMFGGKWANYDNLSPIPTKGNNSGGDGDESLSYQEYVNNLNVNRNSGGLTAADICNEFGEEEISRILKKYGDEPRARKIAQSIVAARPLKTTGDLKDAVAMVTPEFVKNSRRMGRTATLARVFQSLRIVVNDEEGVLREAFEEMAPSLIARGGRLVILTYHSMEDRAAKRVIRDGSVSSKRQSVERDLYGNIIRTKDSSPWRALGKMQKATEEEVKLNSRARSATLRVAEKI
eukprot:CAMPEP_0203679442 /NCGR_PEP_ID=MMETSP0090-20130426/35690_1 /ASSEMBLY_ACC=CAM_ASM_001088 /TAXON_ID=426623 /ORGANISM="Chaetoceros affinis, Strain CCMP159" /LENGTH=583 /DNA_ID=CAMNT_0050547093 /DNA_START=201 /DNA_END=1952 /DNA_ORIENTATION=+